MSNSAVTKTSNELSYDAKTIVTVVLLISVYPLGLVFMFLWMKWPLWVKLLVALPIALLVCIAVLGILAAIVLIAVNPAAQIEKAQCQEKCMMYKDASVCVQECLDGNTTMLEGEILPD